jgi:hypothetical protein
MATSSHVKSESSNPYQPPETALLMAKLRRLPAFLTGLVGLAIGAGFYWVLCGFLLVAYILRAPGIPTPREQAFMVGAAIFHGIPLVTWILNRRYLYQLRLPMLWTLGIACWSLIPISASIMFLCLGI